MTATQKFPDDFEEIIYSSILDLEKNGEIINLSDIIKLATRKLKQRVEPESIFIFVQRMCKEGMVERISQSQYKAIHFDPMVEL